MHDPKQLATLLEASAVEFNLLLTYRNMFGGILAYDDGKPVASLSDVGLALKLSPADQLELLAITGAARLQYEPSSPPSKQYIVVPESILRDNHALGKWLVRSVNYVATLPTKIKKK